jgi:hypothetical protein
VTEVAEVLTGARRWLPWERGAPVRHRIRLEVARVEDEHSEMTPNQQLAEARRRCVKAIGSMRPMPWNLTG